MNSGPLITITSEYGSQSPYLPIIKGVLLSGNPELNLIDISHAISPFDIFSASYVTGKSFPAFPPGSIHMIFVDVNLPKYRRVLLAESDGHVLIASDNGIFSLMFRGREYSCYSIEVNKEELLNSFPEKKIFSRIAIELASGKKPGELGKPETNMLKREMFTPIVQNNHLKGTILYVDGYQNLITDISRKIFDVVASQHKSFEILYRRKTGITSISTHYEDVEGGELLALFNSEGLLEIAINGGNAKDLAGMKAGGQVIIEFYD